MRKASELAKILGGDGSGYNKGLNPDGTIYVEKIPQLGIVEICDGVEIGSNTTIDRAHIGRTYIGPMTKIDNLVQIGLAPAVRLFGCRFRSARRSSTESTASI